MRSGDFYTYQMLLGLTGTVPPMVGWRIVDGESKHANCSRLKRRPSANESGSAS